ELVKSKKGDVYLSTKNITSKASTVYPIIVPIKSNLKSVNFYLVKNNDSITLIDAGYDNDECWEALHQVLADNGLSIYDVERIILTHHHIDHIGLVKRILKLINIPVYAHEKSLRRLKRDPSFLASRVEFYEQLYNEMGCVETSTPYIERIKKMAVDPDGLIIQGEITLLPDEIAGFNVLETQVMLLIMLFYMILTKNGYLPVTYCLVKLHPML